MYLHEYQAKLVLKSHGIPTDFFTVVENEKQIEEAILHLGLDRAVIKAQVHAGGRGKAGGVQIVKGREEIARTAKGMLGFKLVNAQTGPRGLVAKKLTLAMPTPILKEYYLGALIDRKEAKAMLLASPMGGMDIEEVAKTSPDQILRLPIRLDGTLRQFELTRLLKFMGWEGDVARQGEEIARAFALVFAEKDASLLEINPLVLTKNKELLALDAKMAIDDSALYRHPEFKQFYDPTQQSPSEVIARREGIAYVSLEGNIGCMVNGAGLAMATMDMIKLYGGSPANFLDVGGSATCEKIAVGLQLILADPDVRVILVNIFGGIMNCETIAEGILLAFSKGQSLPLVVRMEGTNVEEGRRKLAESGLKISFAGDLAEAAEKAMEAT